MGYLAEGLHAAFFVRLNDKKLKEINKLVFIFHKTKSKRIKKKLFKRIDSFVLEELIEMKIGNA